MDAIKQHLNLKIQHIFPSRLYIDPEAFLNDRNSEQLQTVTLKKKEDKMSEGILEASSL